MSSVPSYRERNALKNATTKIEIALLTKSLRLFHSFGVSSQTGKQLPLLPFPRDYRVGWGGVGWRTQETNYCQFPFHFFLSRSPPKPKSYPRLSIYKLTKCNILQEHWGHTLQITQGISPPPREWFLKFESLALQKNPGLGYIVSEEAIWEGFRWRMSLGIRECVLGK